MNRLTTLLLATATLLTIGCATQSESKPDSIPYGHNRLHFVDDFVEDHIVVNIRDIRDQRGRLIAQVGLLSEANTTAEIEYRFRWFTDQGQLVESPASTWVPVDLRPGDIHEAQSVQPTPDATDFRLSLRKR